MIRRALFCLVVAGCSAGPADVGSTASHSSVIKVYNRATTFAAPRACDLFLERRITDEKARTMEYDAKVDGHAVSIVYSIVAGDSFPLRASLYDAAGASRFSVAIADHALEVRDGKGNVIRTVEGYDGARAATTIQSNDDIGDADGLELLGCALGDRTALGDVAAFMRNLSSGGEVPGQQDVGQTSENPVPVLANWKGDVSLLGAFWLASGCLEADGWSCGCWQSMNDKVIGPVAGWCP